MSKRLDHKLDCKTCGTIYLDIPDDASDDTAIACSTCQQVLGSWGELKHDFYTQSGSGVFDLNEGQIRRR